MERVVYLLGAGFSAPLGLPVMSNFLMKSKDMYSEDPDRYSHFKKVFDRIREMSVCKNYYKADLFNIEEVLSILEISGSSGLSVGTEFATRRQLSLSVGSCRSCGSRKLSA